MVSASPVPVRTVSAASWSAEGLKSDREERSASGSPRTQSAAAALVAGFCSAGRCAHPANVNANPSNSSLTGTRLFLVHVFEVGVAVEALFEEAQQRAALLVSETAFAKGRFY